MGSHIKQPPGCILAQATPISNLTVALLEPHHCKL
jgi:hypothetical protein